MNEQLPEENKQLFEENKENEQLPGEDEAKLFEDIAAKKGHKSKKEWIASGALMHGCHDLGRRHLTRRMRQQLTDRGG